MIRDLCVAMLFNHASRIATRDDSEQCAFVEACLVAEWAWKELGFAGSVMYRPRGVTLRCTCPPPRRVASRTGQVGHVVQRDPLCTIHSRDTI